MSLETTVHCYFPQDLLKEFLHDTPCLIVGLKENLYDYIVLTLLPFDAQRLDLLFLLNVLQWQNGSIIFNKSLASEADTGVNQARGTTSKSSKKKKSFIDYKNTNSKDASSSGTGTKADFHQIAERFFEKLLAEQKHTNIYNVLGFLNFDDHKYGPSLMNLTYSQHNEYPIPTNSISSLKIIMFDVPDPQVMQFYSMKQNRISVSQNNSRAHVADVNIDEATLRNSSTGTDSDNENNIESSTKVKADSVILDKKAPEFLNKLKYHGNLGNLTLQERGFEQIIEVLNNCFFHRLHFYNVVLNQDRIGVLRPELNLTVIKPWEQNFSVVRCLKSLRIFVVQHLYILPTYNDVVKKQQKLMHVELITGHGRSRSNSTAQRIVETYKAKLNILDYYFKFIIINLVIFLRMIIEVFFKLLNFKILGVKNLVEMSLTAQQIDLRLQQFCLIPDQFIKIKKSSSNSNSNFSDYIRLYNTIWLILNDVIFGFTLGQYVLEKSPAIQEFLTQIIIKKLFFKDFYKLTLWLMSFPAGFKLNSKLAIFFGELFLWIIEFFSTKIILSNFFINYIIPGITFLIIYAGGIFGATFVISLVCDFLSFITLHIYCFYFASAKIFNWLLVILKSLFNLFYGKKNNTLKKRIDSADYSLDQLLLGTLLFTITLFIIPTVLAFYLAFTIVRLIVLSCMICLEIILSCLNHFPLFALLLRFKDQFRVPGDINFKILNQTFESSNSTTATQYNPVVYLQLKNVPLSFTRIFYPYLLLLNKLKLYYFSSSTLKHLLTGIPINVSRNKLFQLLYLMLPLKPIEIRALNVELKRNYLE